MSAKQLANPDQLSLVSDPPMQEGKKFSTTMVKNALNYYVEEHQLIAQLSAYPLINFTRRADRQPVQVNINDIVNEYKSYKKEQAKLRRQQQHANTSPVQRMWG